MGKVIQFPQRPECPPHDWIPIYDEDRNLDEEIITGRVCAKCSLIETKRTLALMMGESSLRGEGEGPLPLWIEPYIMLG